MKTLITAAAAIIILTVSSNARSDSYQQNVLLNPSTAQLNAEARGRVMIYDQLDNDTVELAMNTQFDRIGSMMFVRTRFVKADGSIEEDNDCED